MTEHQEYIDFADHHIAHQNEAIASKDSEIDELRQRLAERTTERDYHKRMADKLAERIRDLEAAKVSVDPGTFAGVVVRRLNNLIQTADPVITWEKEASDEMARAIQLIARLT